MKKGLRAMLIGLSILIIALLGLMAYVRLAPSDPVAWNTAPPPMDQSAPAGTVVPLTGGATLLLAADSGAPADLLGRLDAIAVATPRTVRLAGSVAEGRITWETRSALWGFPDYTTAEVRADGLHIHARQRFGREDMGVNAKRLTDWNAELMR